MSSDIFIKGVELPPALTKEQTNDILMSGKNVGKDILTDEQVERLIRGHLRLALGLARRYSKRNNAFNNDLVGIAMLKLIVYVKSIPEDRTSDFELSRWLVGNLKLDLKAFAQSDRLTVSHRNTFQKLLKSGQHPIMIMSLDDMEKQWVKSIDTLEIREAISKATRNERERVIIEMLGEGYSQQEIGIALDLTGARINQILKVIRDRLIDYADIFIGKGYRRDRGGSRQKLGVIKPRACAYTVRDLLAEKGETATMIGS